MSDAAMSVSHRQLTRNVNHHQPSVFPQSHMHPQCFPGMSECLPSAFPKSLLLYSYIG